MQSFRLRAPEPEDVPLIYLWENSTDETHSSLRSGPISRHRLEEYVKNYSGEIHSAGALRYMIETDGRTIGTIDVYDYEPHGRHAFIGIYITTKERGKGFAQRALKEVEELMRRRVGLYALAALVAEDNKRSCALFERCGYNKVGVLEGWLSDGPERINAILYQHRL